MPKYIIILAGYFVSCILGHFIVGPFISKLWKIAEDDLKKQKIPFVDPITPPPAISFWNGFIERAVYTSSIVLGRPEGIAVWLAFKAIIRWKSIESDPRHVPGASIYMIGTAISLAFGVIGGLIATGKTTLL